MDAARYQTATIDDLERDDGWSPIGRALDIRAFGVNAWTAREAGGVVIAEHDELPSSHEELYVVTAGRATFAVDDATIDAPAGTLVFVREPAAVRAAVAAEPGTTVFCVGGEPGAAFRPRSWETNRDVLALFDAGDHAGAKRLLTAVRGDYSDQAPLLYNLACAEAQLGEIETSLAHLEEALNERPSFRADAREDADLAPLHGDPRFAAIVADAEEGA